MERSTDCLQKFYPLCYLCGFRVSAY
eukprot:COSAG02_NODE_17127_length_1026_cov_1.538296_2_plen_25_part_01